jgi:hypothetical protein
MRTISCQGLAWRRSGGLPARAGGSETWLRVGRAGCRLVRAGLRPGFVSVGRVAGSSGRLQRLAGRDRTSRHARPANLAVSTPRCQRSRPPSSRWGAGRPPQLLPRCPFSRTSPDSTTRHGVSLHDHHDLPDECAYSSGTQGVNMRIHLVGRSSASSHSPQPQHQPSAATRRARPHGAGLWLGELGDLGYQLLAEGGEF